MGVGRGPDGGAGARLGQPRRAVRDADAGARGGRLPGRGVRRAGARPLHRPVRVAARVRARAPGGGRRGGPVHGLVGHSLGGAAAALALRDGLAPSGSCCWRRRPTSCASRPPSPTTSGSRPPERSCAATSRPGSRMRWDELHLPTIARSLTARGAAAARPRRRGCAVRPRRGDRRRVARRAARRHGRARPPRIVARPGSGAGDGGVPAWSGRPGDRDGPEESVGAGLVARALDHQRCGRARPLPRAGRRAARRRSSSGTAAIRTSISSSSRASGRSRIPRSACSSGRPTCSGS